MANMPVARNDLITPPYLPFARFLESLDSIATCLPRQISRATWGSESSYTATLLANTYSFLGLSDTNGIPTPVLHRLAGERAARAEILREVLHSAYGDILHAVQKAESAQDVDAALSRFRLTGATHRKAVSFLAQACRYAGLPLPPFSGGRVRISHAKANAALREATGEATSTTVRLRSGGEITLIGRFNPFTISPDDRKFIFRLVDELAEYQTTAELPMEPDSEIDDEVPF
jgi:hypothetical protein